MSHNDLRVLVGLGYTGTQEDMNKLECHLWFFYFRFSSRCIGKIRTDTILARVKK